MSTFSSRGFIKVFNILIRFVTLQEVDIQYFPKETIYSFIQQIFTEP